eukprot:Em0001g1472a
MVEAVQHFLFGIAIDEGLFHKRKKTPAAPILPPMKAAPVDNDEMREVDEDGASRRASDVSERRTNWDNRDTAAESNGDDDRVVLDGVEWHLMRNIIEATNLHTEMAQKPLDYEQLQHFFGILLAMTLASGGERRDMWKTESNGPFPAPALGRYWSGSDRTVVADSAFASLKTAEALHKHRGLRFIGLVKTAHKRFPKAWLQKYPYTNRGDHCVLQANIDGRQYMAVGWNDKKLKMFISSTSRTTEALCPAYKKRFRQSTPEDRTSAPCVVFYKEVKRPAVVEAYFDNANAIDVHNHLRQGALSWSVIGKRKRGGIAILLLSSACASLMRILPSGIFILLLPFFPTESLQSAYLCSYLPINRRSTTLGLPHVFGNTCL